MLEIRRPACFRFVSPVLVPAVLALGSVAAHAQTLASGLVNSVAASGLNTPTSMAFAPDGRLFVLEQSGTIRIVQNDTLLSTPFASFNVDSQGERGLIGIAFDPNFATNNFLYLYKTVPASPTNANPYNEIVRVMADGNTIMPGSETPIFRLPDLSSATNHNGGSLNFLPDGTLMVGVGENAQPLNSLDTTTTLGKILRVNSDGSIPTDNPFYNTLTGDNRAIWALGLRNPYTTAVQPGTGLFYINDVGQNTYEEINLGIAGANCGWPFTEGPMGAPNGTLPIYYYQHGFDNPFEGDAITGGAFYNPTNPTLASDYIGQYFFSDYTAGWIDMYDPLTGSVANIGTGLGSPVDLDVSNSNGSLYYLSIGDGTVHRISATAVAPEPSSAAFALLAASGLFLQHRRRRNN